MKFSKEKHLTFEEAVEIMFRQLGDWKIMALATSVNDHVTVRNVSCLFYDNKIYFKTDKTSEKQNSFLRTRRSLCAGAASRWRALPKTRDWWQNEPGKRFEKGYKEFLWNSYNAYSHVDTEILIQVTPKHVEVWDTSDGQYAYQLFIDFDSRTVEVKPYDVKK